MYILPSKKSSEYEEHHITAFLYDRIFLPLNHQ